MPPSMKPMHKRLYTVLPRPVPPARVRSNSASSSRSLFTASSSSNPLAFFDSPSQPPSSPRPGQLTRFTAEVKAEVETPSPYSNHHGQNAPQSQSNSSGPPPYTLALTSGHSDSPAHITPPNHYPVFPYSSFDPIFLCSPEDVHPANSTRTADRPGTRYHLDVGAYGIPKRSHASVAGRDGHGKFGATDKRADHPEALERAVQVGEDAYFARDNAMGVADGVGGWSKSRHVQRGSEASPSALFARRLMHFCSEEVEAATASSPADTPSPYEADELYAELEDSLEELEEGLDVLMILEKAYEKTIRAHVGPHPTSDPVRSQNDSLPATPYSPGSRPREPPPSSEARPSVHGRSPLSTSASPALSSAALAAKPSPRVPLTEGSSTALLAILEHAPTVARPRPSPALFSPRPRRASTSAQVSAQGAVIKIAHLGDCMAMLIRGEEIVWRTDEMWWNFNTPVQLGPSSPTRPADARVFTIPVQADDILILASDGLSDNLWDEDVLDEVVRFRRPFLADRPGTGAGAGAGMPKAFGRNTMAAMLSEALCSRARRVSERRRRAETDEGDPELDLPFARRAKEHGKTFQGGKPDDISVLVAVVSPVEPKP
ncbi:hypothetical protein OBBRIDRAFT_785629 [Obba rivulosa]|uniref:Protein phosphatase n=1 Tax=Obba rivulosa TaxID=1052685 RepID=A0A8E2AMV3_9APHY|nr:hypothetical protein OBBRIDRAFT_785629 [Obba rivulosa]